MKYSGKRCGSSEILTVTKVTVIYSQQEGQHLIYPPLYFGQQKLNTYILLSFTRQTKAQQRPHTLILFTQYTAHTTRSTCAFTVFDMSISHDRYSFADILVRLIKPMKQSGSLQQVCFRRFRRCGMRSADPVCMCS